MSDVAARAEEGFFRRLRGDAELVSLIGAGARILPGWPADTLQAADFPRLTFYLFGPGPRRPGFERLRAAVDEWVWPTGTAGGRPKLLAVDARLLALFDEQLWTYDGVRVWSYALGFRDAPAPPTRAMRRTREIVLEASPLT